MRTTLLAAVVSTSGAAAAPLTVQSYEMQNGETGSYTYWDDSYDGSGNPGQSGSYLSGGTGDLTDGVIATQNWNVTPGLYVGWNSIVPDITFHFANAVVINTVTLHLDDSNGFGGVAPPSQLVLTVGGSVQTYNIPDGASGAPFTFTVDGLTLTGDSARIQLLDGAGTWIMLSEVEFNGVPAPAAAPLLGLFLGVGARRRR